VAVNTEKARKLRRWLEVSQEAMAARIGVHRLTLARWEAGQREPRADELQRWARELGISVDELLGGPNPAEVAP
jgi:transcriptional regulator with XRE-family HTH domain